MYKTLEEEFADFRELHKCLIISSCLIACENEGIYESSLLNSYSHITEKGSERADIVLADLIDRSEDGEEELFNSVYQMCWDKIKNRISDKKSYHLD